MGREAGWLHARHQRDGMVNRAHQWQPWNVLEDVCVITQQGLHLGVSSRLQNDAVHQYQRANEQSMALGPTAELTLSCFEAYVCARESHDCT